MAAARSLTDRAGRAARPYLRRLPVRAEENLRRVARSVGRRGPGAPTAALPSVGSAVRPRGVATADIRPMVGCGQRAARFARRAPTVILMYHRIAEEPFDPFRLAVRPDRFVAQLAALRQFGEPVPLGEVTRPSRRPRMALTFDDGYADNADVALDALRCADVPATVFVTSRLIDATATLWPLRLEELFRLGRPRSGRLHVDAGGPPFDVALGPGDDRMLAMFRTHDMLRDRHPSDTAAAMAQIEEQLGSVPHDPARRMLSRDELLRLARSGLVTIGAHTRHHPWLSRMTTPVQTEEIGLSRQDLQGVIGQPVTEFAYPFGTRRALDRRSVRAVRAAGYSLACTTFPDPLVAGTSRFLLPRRQVLDWDRDQFSAALDRWLSA